MLLVQETLFIGHDIRKNMYAIRGVNSTLSCDTFDQSIEHRSNQNNG